MKSTISIIALVVIFIGIVYLGYLIYSNNKKSNEIAKATAERTIMTTSGNIVTVRPANITTPRTTNTALIRSTTF